MLPCLWIGFVAFVSTTIAGRDSWSRWYNTDSPADGDDEEILQIIRQTGKPRCIHRSTRTQCRVVGTITLFSDARNVADNFLSTPCNQSGVVCLAREQRPGVNCRDYEIRYSCDKSDEKHSKISSDGGFIALIASLSVLVPILGVMSIHFLRACRERRQKEKRSRDVQSTDQPPSYDEVCNNETRRVGNTAAISLPEMSSLEVSSSSGTSSPIPGVGNSSGNDVCHSAVRNNERRGCSGRTGTPEASVFVISGRSTQREIDNRHMVPEPPPSYAEALEILKLQSGVV
ncbi:uncharacterized protein LOC121387732 [Gigantopelta aegis]|uniref:uncharacterized protein LOC121387732 n=1 Tax=Gigantopelta aegis TaxID=1735272 RepID=UPI001B88D377|nr:uncharacterized protein LOC121387732 [Gigantopelta aegis]